MKRFLPLLLAVFGCLSILALPSLSAPVLAVKDLNATVIKPLDAKGQKATVLFFITQDCPIANGYAPEIKRICQKYAAQNIALYVVYVDPSLSLAAARKHAHSYGYAYSAALLDSHHTLVKYAGASVTPEAAVFGPDGKLRYRGRIDDQYPSLGQRREVVTKRDLRDSLDSVLAGKSVPTPVTKAVGCFIPPLG